MHAGLAPRQHRVQELLADTHNPMNPLQSPMAPDCSSAATPRQSPVHRARANSPVEPQLTQTQQLPDFLNWQLGIGGQNGQRNRKIKPDPRFGNHAGLRLTVIFTLGHFKPLFTTAARTRSRASLRAVSGNPTIESPGRPWLRSASTSTMCARTPSPRQRTFSRAPSLDSDDVFDLGWTARCTPHRDNVDAQSINLKRMVCQPLGREPPQPTDFGGVTAASGPPN